MFSSLLSHVASVVVILALTGLFGVSALPSGWDQLDNEARDILARAAPAAPHFVVYGDQYVSGTTGPPATSQITVCQALRTSILS